MAVSTRESTTSARDQRGEASSAPPAISLRGVSKSYGGQIALQPTTLEIRDGEFFCLLGPSGCGKTTTLNLIGGFVAPSAGEIHIQGERVDRLPPHRRRVNTVFQSYALFPHMTVRENVGFGLRMAKVPRSESATRVGEALALVGLDQFGERLPGQLSGGQQQRVAVARALVNRPAVLLLDEPLGALDLKLRKRLQVELAQIHRDVGTTFVYVTHDQEEAMSMADRIAVMNEGEIEQIGTPSEVYYRPHSRFVSDFIGDSNFLEAEVEGGQVVLLDGSRVPCEGARGALAGAATLVVRPESVHVSARTGARPGSVPGHVVQTSFLGSYTRVAVDTDASPVPVIAGLYGAERGAAEELTPGTEVALWWEPADAVLLEGVQQEEEESR
jgi:spermidine/putrescine ABC transporter ATP-binding subunit